MSTDFSDLSPTEAQIEVAKRGLPNTSHGYLTSDGSVEGLGLAYLMMSELVTSFDTPETSSSAESMKNISSLFARPVMRPRLDENSPVVSDADGLDEVILWVDVETSGVDPSEKELLEVAAVLTDMEGEPLARGVSSLVKVASVSETIKNSDVEARRLHEASGLWESMWNEASLPVGEVESMVVDYLPLSGVSSEATVYFGGSSPTLDRNFLKHNMPGLYSRISHRTIDASTLMLAFEKNGIVDPFRLPPSGHRALGDIYDSINRYRYYMDFAKNAKRICQAVSKLADKH